ncbi:MAG: hypothetical protein IT430_15440 [Phycisphaerales bacterium]|nr:hypothetical protein [Phycisphaerales bacterium]
MSGSQDHNPQHPKIRFSEPTGFGASSSSASSGSSGFEVEHEELSPVDLPNPAPLVEGSKKIRTFERHGGGPESEWNRRPNVTGAGAIHVRTFHSKLNSDSLAFMDQTINEWLDAHPEYEVKFVTSTIGEFTGKVREPALICQVWV